MNRIGVFFLFALLASPPAFSNDHPDKPSFPDDSQINLLITQSERAFETYELAIKQEQLKFGKQSQEGVVKHQQVLDRVRKYLPKLKANPQGFNSPVGFLLVVDLNDASRNMTVCMAQAGIEASLSAVAGNSSAGESKVALRQTCMGASQLLYTVSETAVAMYEQYLLANRSLEQKGEKALGKCMDILNRWEKRGLTK